MDALFVVLAVVMGLVLTKVGRSDRLWRVGSVLIICLRPDGVEGFRCDPSISWHPSTGTIEE